MYVYQIDSQLSNTKGTYLSHMLLELFKNIDELVSNISKIVHIWRIKHESSNIFIFMEY